MKLAICRARASGSVGNNISESNMHGLKRTLYVIGNGFDLWHGIPSSYSKFREYVDQNDSHLFDDVEEYLVPGDEWNDLEGALASLDPDMLIDNLSHFMTSYGADDWSDSGHHDFQYEVEETVSRLSAGLRVRFGEWIRQLPIPIGPSVTRRLASLEKRALFLNFNYTSTLQSIYGVRSEDVLFIHGCAAQANADLILGHAWNPRSRPRLNSYGDPAERDVRLTEVNDIIDNYFEETFKKSAAIILANRPFFDGLTDVSQVIVLGHSLSSVDAEYFRELLKSPGAMSADWVVACRTASEFPDKVVALNEFGVDPTKVAMRLWDDL